MDAVPRFPSQPITFHPFPRLPLELRLKIYSFILRTPRIVSIHYARKPNPSIPLTQHHYQPQGPSRVLSRNTPRQPPKCLSTFTGWASHTPVPALLQTCKEAREETLKACQLAFGSDFHEAKVWFNFDVDVLHFTHPLRPSEASLQTVAKNSDHSHSKASTQVMHSHPPPSLVAAVMEGPSSYLVDLFLSGGYNGANDSEKVKYLVIEISEELYGLKNFCWDEIRQFTSLEELKLLIWVDWRAGIGEGRTKRLLESFEMRLRSVRMVHKDWMVPRVWVAEGKTGEFLGEVETRDEER